MILSEVKKYLFLYVIKRLNIYRIRMRYELCKNKLFFVEQWKKYNFGIKGKCVNYLCFFYFNILLLFGFNGKKNFDLMVICDQIDWL